MIIIDLSFENKFCKKKYNLFLLYELIDVCTEGTNKQMTLSSDH